MKCENMMKNKGNRRKICKFFKIFCFKKNGKN